MTDLDKAQAAGATPDYIAIIKAAKEHGVLHLSIGSFSLTMQSDASLSRVSQLHQAAPTRPTEVSIPGFPLKFGMQTQSYSPTADTTVVYNPNPPRVSTSSTAEIAKPAKAALEKLHAKRKQFDDFRNMKPPSETEGGGDE